MGKSLSLLLCCQLVKELHSKSRPRACKQLLALVLARQRTTPWYLDSGIASLTLFTFCTPVDLQCSIVVLAMTNIAYMQCAKLSPDHDFEI